MRKERWRLAGVVPWPFFIKVKNRGVIQTQKNIQKTRGSVYIRVVTVVTVWVWWQFFHPSRDLMKLLHFRILRTEI